MLLAFALLCGGCDSQGEQLALTKAPVFISASSPAEVRNQIAKLPLDDVWWNVYGKDQAWNFKNLHRFMPTVNIYRDGQVRMLTQRPMSAIPNQMVDTPIGIIDFKDFWIAKCPLL